LIQSIIHQLVRTTLQTLETIWPTLAGKLATKLFFTPFRHKRPKRELQFIKDARRQEVAVSENFDKSVPNPHFVMYEWGQGPTVLLVHGWGGRGSQVATMAQPLIEAGYRVVTFDGLAHGDSPGKQTTLLDFQHIINQIEEMEGGLQAMIGHSFGGVAAALALSESTRAEKLVTIGSPATMKCVFDGFSQQTGITQKSIDKVIQSVETVAQRPVDDFSLVKMAARLDLPGLIVHDTKDKEVGVDEAYKFANCWPNGQLLITEGLGHRRILRDAATISKIVDFIDGRDGYNGYSKIPTKLPLDEASASGII
jgi:pimeloyl-ACP methyl ester carboxylesterase